MGSTAFRGGKGLVIREGPSHICSENTRQYAEQPQHLPILTLPPLPRSLYGFFPHR